jgi:Mrp family chromosome partitioning ATPase/capsular polysaccharide biosynthesis protein
MKGASIEQGRFDPTVFGAVRRYWIMVLVIALLAAAAAVGYSLVVPEVYRASATVTLAQTQTSRSLNEDSEQYLDSQVLLLQSQVVADRAARFANAELNANVLSTGDFRGDNQSLKITPPDGSNPGSYGSSLVRLSFTWPNARVAQAGANAVLQAFDDVRVAAINDEAEAAVAGIEKAMADVRTKSERRDLVNQRTQTLVNQQLDLARRPTIAWAAQPQLPINGNSKITGAIGLMIGTVLGAGLAYARALRRRSLGDRFDPAAIYYEPLIVEIPWILGRKLSSRSAAARSLPLATDPQSTRAETLRFAAGYVERTLSAHGNRLAVAFVSTDTSGARSSVVANLALAVAESGTPVLAVDADYTKSSLTSLLLPGSPPADGFAQVLAGQRSVDDCVQRSPLNERLSVLGSGHAETVRPKGAAYSRAVDELIGKAKAAFDLVLIDSPALLRVAEGTELVANSDAAIIVIGSDERVRDHITMAERLDLVKSEVIGYIYQRKRRGLRPRRHPRDRSPAPIPRQTESSDFLSWS